MAMRFRFRASIDLPAVSERSPMQAGAGQTGNGDRITCIMETRRAGNPVLSLATPHQAVPM